jgi:hypothetical protein
MHANGAQWGEQAQSKCREEFEKQNRKNYVVGVIETKAERSKL